MLTITVPGVEEFDHDKQMFVYSDDVTLKLEHSLVSLSKWEAKYEKAFLGPDKKSTDETFGYIQCMSLDEEIPEDVFLRLTQEHLTEINEYIEAKQTATWFRDIPPRPGARPEIITNEIIRYWMVTYQVPLEYESRHLNILFTLIKVINEKNKPADKNKRPKADMLAERKRLNEERRAQMNTKG